jgi:hypothetical protein
VGTDRPGVAKLRQDAGLTRLERNTARQRSDAIRAALTPRPDGRLPFPEPLFAVPKKSGKTALAARIVLYVIVCLDGHGVLPVAATRWGVLLMLPAISRRGRNGVSAPVKQAVGHIENLPP